MKTLIFIADEPGGAQAIAPIAAWFLNQKELNYEVLVYAQNSGLERLKDIGLKPIPLDFSQINLEAFIINQPHALWITGTSIGSNLERDIWFYTHKHKLMSCCILDQWMNLAPRFKNLNWNNLDAQSEWIQLPDYIICPDDDSKQELIDAGIDSSKLYSLGQPWLDYCIQNPLQTSPDHNSTTKILFYSEPITQDYQNENFWGFSELSTLKCLGEVLEKVHIHSNFEFWIKPHPRENQHQLQLFLENQNWKFPWKIVQGYNSQYWTSHAHLICGMSSMALLEALCYGKPTISILLNLKRKSPFVPDLRKWMNSIRTPNGLHFAILEYIKYKRFQSQFEISTQINSIQRVVSFIKDLT